MTLSPSPVPERLRRRGPKIAHIRDWAEYEATGQIKGLCGKRLKGLPAGSGYDACVVCLSLAHGRRWGSR